YLPLLVEMVRTGAVRPEVVLTEREPLTDVIAAYRAFDTRRPGWIKVELLPAGSALPPAGVRSVPGLATPGLQGTGAPGGLEGGVEGGGDEAAPAGSPG